MLRLPSFVHRVARDVAHALELRSEAGADAAFVAGGTDLFPNMKRLQQTPATVISLAGVASLRSVEVSSDGWIDVGSCVTLAALARDARVASAHPAVAHAAECVSTPPLRNMGTIGGNLLLDTRCNYYDQGYEWRRAINFCMKRDGEICWVAPSSRRCWAVQSSDGAPVAVALGAEVSLAGAGGVRRIRAADLYANDGIAYLTKEPEELLTTYHLPPPDNTRATYVKLRRRGAFDFPVLGVAAWVRLGDDGTVEDARIVLGAVASWPQLIPEAGSELIGRPLSHESIAAAADAAYRPAKPMDNTDFTLSWRKDMVRVHVQRALEQLRGVTPGGAHSAK